MVGHRVRVWLWDGSGFWLWSCLGKGWALAQYGLGSGVWLAMFRVRVGLWRSVGVTVGAFWGKVPSNEYIASEGWNQGHHGPGGPARACASVRAYLCLYFV